MLEVLSENEYVSLADLQKFTNGSHSTVKALEKKKISIEKCMMTVERKSYWNRVWTTEGIGSDTGTGIRDK